MNLKEIISKIGYSYPVIVTGIVISMFAFCALFNPGVLFPLSDIGRILIAAAATDLPYLLYYSSRELDKKAFMVRLLLHMIIIAVILLVLAGLWDWIELSDPLQVCVYLLLVTGVFICVYAVISHRDRKTADQLNSRLQERYHSDQL